MIALTDEMREALDQALNDGAPALVATAAASGEPDIAFKGSTMVWDAEHLAFWERSHGQTIANLAENPHVCILYRNPTTRAAWKFFGVAELHPGGELREQIMAKTNRIELDRDPERKGVAVLIRVDRVTRGREVLMQRDA